MASAKLQTPEGFELVLRLSRSEADALRTAMQNPLYEDESEELNSIRTAIWDALSRTPSARG